MLDDDLPVATAAVRPSHPAPDTEWEVKRVYVADDYRGRGISKQLMLDLHDRAIAAGIQTMVLQTGALQPAAHGLYESLGYERVGVYPPYGSFPGERFYRLTLSMHRAPLVRVEDARKQDDGVDDEIGEEVEEPRDRHPARLDHALGEEPASDGGQQHAGDPVGNSEVVGEPEPHRHQKDGVVNREPSNQMRQERRAIEEFLRKRVDQRTERSEADQSRVSGRPATDETRRSRNASRIAVEMSA